ncbi:uncharacterized protein C16orf46 homolog [Chaetodon trifascialis]|uniref:uncharacterized protein C16orf46 homolog n=1 Tax=Chaetodon trifascialis TaxID=109706 RepID=UPI003993A096
MATVEEVDNTAVNGPDRELPAQEDAVGEQPYKTPDRRHVDALLDISEEDFLKDLEPYEYHGYSGWEEAVQGWTRAAPLSCILLTQKRSRKPKHKEVDTPAPLSVDPVISASIAEHHCDSHVPNSFKKSMPLNQHTGSWSTAAVAALQTDASEWPVHNAVQKTMSNFLLEEQIEEEGMHRRTPLQNRPSRPQKHRASNTVVPIKNFTFLPPIDSPPLNPLRVSGKKAPEGDTTEENCFMFDKKNGTRGTRVDPVANPELPTYSACLTSKYQTCQHNPHFFSAVHVSIPKRDTAHRTSFSMGKSLTKALHSSTTAGAQARMRPSKTMCAVKLYEGCEINV